MIPMPHLSPVGQPKASSVIKRTSSAMPRLLLPSIPVHSELTQAAIGLFKGQECGHLDRFQYSVPLFQGDAVQGARLWDQFLSEGSDYSIPREEVELISLVAQDVTRNIAPLNEFIDLGPGSLNAFRTKSMPLIRAVRAEIYRPVDLCQYFLRDIMTEVQRYMRDIEVRPEKKDFLLDLVDTARNRACVYWGGIGFSNIGTRGAAMPLDEIRARFQRVRRFIPKGGTALITFHTCQNRHELLSAYDHPTFAEFTENTFQRIARDCPDIVFDPSPWRYEPFWNQDLHTVEHRLVATSSQTIYLPRERIFVTSGDHFVVDHSFKLPPDIILKVAKSAGWSSAEMSGKDGSIQMLMLKA